MSKKKTTKKNNDWVNSFIQDEDKIYELNTKEAIDKLTEACVKSQKDILKELSALTSINDNAKKTDREKALKESYNNISSILDKLEARYGSTVTESLNKTYSQSYSNIISLLKKLEHDIRKSKPSNVKNIIKTKWTGIGFIDRIKYNISVLKYKIKDAISTGFMRKDSLRNISRAISKSISSSFNNLKSLVRTEVQAVQIKANVDNYKSNDIEKVRVSTILDDRTCSNCSSHKDKIVRLDKSIIGKDLPPFHTHCRCVIIPVLD